MIDTQWLENLDDIVGKHLIHTYENGSIYELYIRSESSIDYRVHRGKSKGKWRIRQETSMQKIANDVFKLSWTESSGTFICLTVNLESSLVHGTACIPKWIQKISEDKTGAGNAITPMNNPADKSAIQDQFGLIIFMRDAGENNDSVIDCPPSHLPANYPSNLKPESPALSMLLV